MLLKKNCHVVPRRHEYSYLMNKIMGMILPYVPLISLSGIAMMFSQSNNISANQWRKTVYPSIATPFLVRSLVGFVLVLRNLQLPLCCLWTIVCAFIFYFQIGHCIVGVMIVWQLDLQLHVESVPITTNVVSSSPARGEVYLIQHYLIEFVSDLRQVGGFLRVLWFHPPIKLSATI